MYVPLVHESSDGALKMQRMEIGLPNEHEQERTKVYTVGSNQWSELLRVNFSLQPAVLRGGGAKKIMGAEGV